MPGTPRSVVAMGGGHGLHATLRALRILHEEWMVSEITAIVTVADDGGSSGRLRKEFGVLPPGDLRMALAALCGDDEWGRTWAEVFQHRFAGTGEMQGHALGNLVLVGLWELLGDHVKALEWAGTLLGAHGRVLPMASTPLEITARVRGLDPSKPHVCTTVRGQGQVAATPGTIETVSLDPVDPDACPEAVEAILSADHVVLGPGSWYTSVIPHLMVPGLRAALLRTNARKVVLLNLDAPEGEADGLTPHDHLRVLGEHAPELRLDVVVADPRTVEDPQALTRAASDLGAELVLAEVGVPGRAQHDPDQLAPVLGRVLGSQPGTRARRR